MARQGEAGWLFTNRGELIRVQLAPSAYLERGRVQLIEPTWPFAGRKVAWAAPAYANRSVYARSDSEVLCASLAASP
jgi:hypothetical protein